MSHEEQNSSDLSDSSEYSEEEMVVASKRPRDDRLKLEDEMRPERVRRYLEECRRYYAQIMYKYIQPVWPYEIVLDDNGNLVPLGVDLPPPEFDTPEPLSWKAPKPRFVNEAQEELTGPKGLRDEAAYDSLVTEWADLPEGCHFAWIDGLEKLRALEPQQRKTKALLDLVRACVLMEQADKGFVEDVIARVQEGDTLEDEVLSSKLPSAFGRIMGVGPMSDLPAQENLWEDHFLKQMRPAQEDAAASVKLLLGFIQALEQVNGLRKLIKIVQITDTMKTTVALIQELQHGNAAWPRIEEALRTPGDVSMDMMDSIVGP